MKLMSVYFSVFVLLSSCTRAGDHSFPDIKGYRLSQPDEKMVLPSVLHEISGITTINDQTVACVQDEKGVVFMYDLIKKQLVNELPFGDDGDYEGIAIHNQDIYVLRSDGNIFELKGYPGTPLQARQYITGIPAKDNEGLCFDGEQGRLLIGSKSKIGKGPEFKDQRHIYSFELKAGKLSSNPAYVFDTKVINNLAKEKQLRLTEKKKKDGTVKKPEIAFRISALAIHPVTGQLYLLSADDHMLFVIEPDGKITEMVVLDSQMFNKAEGITFLSNGDMLISNEGQHKKPSLLRFKYKP